jgi:hypothetical protein
LLGKVRIREEELDEATVKKRRLKIDRSVMSQSLSDVTSFMNTSVFDSFDSALPLGEETKETEGDMKISNMRDYSDHPLPVLFADYAYPGEKESDIQDNSNSDEFE